MSSNYTNAYSLPNTPALNIADLTVGDTLIQADWNYSNPTWNETVWTVTKVLKTRVQLERTYAFRAGETRTVIHRVLVRNDKAWGGRNGQLDTRLEGDSAGYSRTRVYLFTPDDAQLETLRDNLVAAVAANVAKRAAKTATEEFVRYSNTETAEAAILALQAYIATQKEA